MDRFWSTNTGEPQQNSGGRVGYMADWRQEYKIQSVILHEHIYATQQVIALFKSVLHHSLIKNVKSAGLIVSSKEIKVVFFH